MGLNEQFSGMCLMNLFVHNNPEWGVGVVRGVGMYNWIPHIQIDSKPCYLKFKNNMEGRGGGVCGREDAHHLFGII